MLIVLNPIRCGVITPSLVMLTFFGLGTLINLKVPVFGINLDSEEGSFSLDGFDSRSESAYLFEFTPETDLYSQ